MPSLKRHEGYLLVDHRASPGLPDWMLRWMGLPVKDAQGLIEVATFTCSHCNDVVVKNPERQRERAYCPKCDHYICDGCGAIRGANGGECKTFNQVIEEVQEKGVESTQAGGSVVLLGSTNT